MTLLGLSGASGFIGKHVIELCAELNINFVDISLRGSKEDIAKSLKHFNKLCHYSQSASIIHLAENNEISNAESSGIDYVLENTSRIENILLNTTAKITYASSAGVYGDIHQEVHLPDKKIVGQNLYSQSKLACEKLVLDSGGTVARISNVYGPGMSKKNIISEVLAQINKQDLKKVQIRDGSPIRDFINVKDVASCLIYMSRMQKKGVYNVATGSTITMKELTLKILSIFGKSNCIIEETNKSKIFSSISLDISNTKNTFNWSPKISLAQGLKKLK